MKIKKYILMSVVGFMASLLSSCVFDDVSDNPVINISGIEIKATGLNNGVLTLTVGQTIQHHRLYPTDTSRQNLERARIVPKPFHLRAMLLQAEPRLKVLFS